MSPPPDDLPSEEPLFSPAQWPGHPEIEPCERCNLLLLALHQIVFRIGWIFKTESVIMPAVLDQLSGAGWLRGCLPMLNRFGQSVPPVFLAEYFKTLRYKKRALAAFTALMGVPFAVLSLVWLLSPDSASGPWQNGFAGPRYTWLPGVFLLLYLAFFVFNGLYHVSFGTVQGKLIRPTRRGRLLLTSTFWGSLPAMLLAWCLLDRWLRRPDGGFGYVFAFTSICFILAGMTAMALFEPADPVRPPVPAGKRGSLGDMFRTLRRDANLRRLLLVAALFGSGLIIFPHYQALARDALGLSGIHLMVWVITQNMAVGVYSLFVGPLADGRGNRLTLRLLVFGSAIAPAFAISLVYLPGGLGAKLFWLVFIPLGISPLVLRTLLNYALEICQPEEHPRYLSTVSLGLSLPFLLSPAVGWLVDAAGFEVVFMTTVVLITLSGLMTFGLEEPRHRTEPDGIHTVGVGVADD
jgi:hypothetical protein